MGENRTAHTIQIDGKRLVLSHRDPVVASAFSNLHFPLVHGDRRIYVFNLQPKLRRLRQTNRTSCHFDAESLCVLIAHIEVSSTVMELHRGCSLPRVTPVKLDKFNTRVGRHANGAALFKFDFSPGVVASSQPDTRCHRHVKNGALKAASIATINMDVALDITQAHDAHLGIGTR